MSMPLSPELSARVQRWIDSGRYPDADSVIRARLKLLNEQEKLEQARAVLAEGDGDVAQEHKVSPDVLP